jgi:tRNA pseudouridine38/39 synthase
MAEKAADDYTKWTKDSLIDRVRQLEHELKRRPEAPSPQPPSHAPQEPGSQAVPVVESGHVITSEEPPSKKRKEKKVADPSTYSFRYIALKLAYLGRNYGGFEYASSGVLPSVEEELFKALTKARLIFPEDERVVDFGNCEYSKCGRTDRGVSAFGQVIGLKIRSARPVPGLRKKPKKTQNQKASTGEAAGAEGQTVEAEEEVSPPEPPPFDPIRDELPYPKLINRLLPRDIRILAWCPSPPPDFSARFSCRERQYRYFFTQPAFNPPPPSSIQENSGWLDIDAMRDAARRYEGEHDFRNYCKVDPSKNITNYKRRILESTIEEVPDMGSALPHIIPTATEGTGSFPKVYCFKVRGTAFLWHQIRHMVSILFNVGQRLEKPELVSQLLDIENNPRRPVYVMADETPLVLWDCLFTDDDGKDLDWIHAEDDVDPTKPAVTHGAIDGVWKLWRETKMDEILANGLLRRITEDRVVRDTPLQVPQVQRKKAEASVRLFEGGNSARAGGKYIPVMKMRLMETVAEQNDKFAQRKGFKDAEDMMKQKAAKWD